ncbi:MAG: GNAT family N-acetyltransferase [Candidatus Bathyarchaeia archaeon]|jgi:ribosomal-protein-alanine N-acetyltransferase
MKLPLETERLWIQLFRLEDAERLHIVFSDPEVMARIRAGPSPSIEVTRQRLARIMEHQDKNGFSMWALIEKGSGVLIGDCGLILVEWRGPEVELAYEIGRAFWGKGYATEAARACLRFGFENLKLSRIIALTDADHLASRRVIEKIGMKNDGIVHYYGRSLVQYSATKPNSESAQLSLS